MIQSITVDIINEKALKLLEDLELLKLIRLRKDKIPVETNLIGSFKGAMSKQSIKEIDIQLNELRKEWE
jgi:hypothetical protein